MSPLIYLLIVISSPIRKELLSTFKDYFNVRDYFDQQSAHSETILEFQYIKDCCDYLLLKLFPECT